MTLKQQRKSVKNEFHEKLNDLSVLGWARWFSWNQMQRATAAVLNISSLAWNYQLKSVFGRQKPMYAPSSKMLVKPLVGKKAGVNLVTEGSLQYPCHWSQLTVPLFLCHSFQLKKRSKTQSRCFTKFRSLAAHWSKRDWPNPGCKNK